MTRFTRILSVLLLTVFLIPASVYSQSDSGEPDWRNNELYQQGLDDWHDGHYPDVLRAFRQLLDGPDAEYWFKPVALKTGELYRVRELSEDGTAIRFSSDGRFALYEKDGEEAKGRRTWLYDLQENETAGSVDGNDVRVLNGGSLLYRRVVESESLQEAAARRDSMIDRARSEGNYDIWRQAQSEYQAVELEHTRLFHRDGIGDSETDITPEGFAIGELVASSDGSTLYFTGRQSGQPYPNIYALSLENGSVQSVTQSNAFENGLQTAGSGRFLVFDYASGNLFDPGSEQEAEIEEGIGVYDLENGSLIHMDGELENVSRTGNRVLISKEEGDSTILFTRELGADADEVEIVTADVSLADAVLSPEGTRVAYAMRDGNNYEIYVHNADGTGRKRVTLEIQHDRFPVFLDENHLIAAKGEGRHRRSFLYDLERDETIKLFHNNTVRTIAPEYQWAVHPEGNCILIVAERDGDTISPERGVYLLNLNRQISMDDLRDRIDTNLAREVALREKGHRLFSVITDEVAEVTGRASLRRVYQYEKDLYEFDSKYITQPGNDQAAEYLYDTYASFGYEPEYQWFNPGRGTYGGKTANVIARLEGTTNPELVYVISSHYDSAERGPGADDNTSGTAALLETARLLADRPLPYTVIFASFTGEEAGLLGSREFVRQAQESGMQIAGALNNDMVGFANNSRLDNTIRYSNAGIRDIQHAASFMFTDLVTYDAHYYKSTDAHAYYEAYGDIVGGIGSYPVLGSPFYHQPNDNLETINHQLVTEVAKTTTATIMLLASSPSRLTGLQVEKLETGPRYRVSWNPSPESDVEQYKLEYETRSGETNTVTVTEPEATIEQPAPDSEIRVKAINSRGIEGWDWARTEAE